MQIDLVKWEDKSWFNFILWIYRKSIFLYPKQFRLCFGTEMIYIFNELLIESSQKSFWTLLLFLGREIINAPKSIFQQHMEARSFWLRPYPINMLAFIIGFTLLGMIEQGFIGLYGWAFACLSFGIIGGVFGLAISIALVSSRKILFTMGGAVGFVLANTVVKQAYFRTFPEAYIEPGEGIYFLIPFLLPILAGSIFGLFIGLASGNMRSFFRWTVVGGVAMMSGFFMNRLIAALMLSYVFTTTPALISQMISPALISYLLLPYVLEGIFLGSIFAKNTQRRISITI